MELEWNGIGMELAMKLKLKLKLKTVALSLTYQASSFVSTIITIIITTIITICSALHTDQLQLQPCRFADTAQAQAPPVDWSPSRLPFLPPNTSSCKHPSRTLLLTDGLKTP
jgi:hypothetical protein